MPKGYPGSGKSGGSTPPAPSAAEGVFVATESAPQTPLGALTYEELIRQNGAVRDPSTGRTVRFVPDGSTRPSKTKDGKWVQASEKRFIANSLDEAREKGMKWDFYATELHCNKKNCNQLIQGWVRGGRKLEQEHAHIMADRYGVPDVMEVSDPAIAGEDQE